MTVAAVMLVKDEADVIESTLRHLRGQVDAVIVADNNSRDGTRDILDGLAAETADAWLDVRDDPEPGYYQDTKTTKLALEVYERGYDWVLPCDADEFWYSPSGRVGDVLDRTEPEVLFSKAVMFNHMPTGLDGDAASPFERIGWRLRERGLLEKVACRARPDLRIDMGNHDAVSSGLVRSNWSHTDYESLVIRHFPWRSEAQFLSKITNGAAAYHAAVGLDPTYGEHWKAFGLPGDADFPGRVKAWFWQWGFRVDPTADDDLVFDPAAAENTEEFAT